MSINVLLPYTLKEPLSKDEEKNLFEIVKYSSNTTDVDKAKESLINHNLRLVLYISNKYSNIIHAEDLFSVGCIGLIKAVNSFDVSKNIQFATFATKCIQNEIFLYFRKNNKHLDNNISLFSELHIDKDGNSLTIEETLVDGSMEENFERNYIKEHIKDIIAKFSDTDRFIMEASFGLNNSNPLTQQEIAGILNMSQSYVSRKKEVLLKEIKKKYVL